MKIPFKIRENVETHSIVESKINIMKNIPNRIYLQTGLEHYGETCDDFGELNSSLISWCADKIYNDDLEFISVSSVLRRIKELEEEIENGDSTYSETSCRIRINELKKLITF